MNEESIDKKAPLFEWYIGKTDNAVFLKKP
jgi:hypothetical protein